MHVCLAGPDTERWAALLAELGHESSLLRAAAVGQVVLITGRDVAACAAAAAAGANVVAADVTDEVAAAMVEAGACRLWRADASPAWLRLELTLLARSLEQKAELARSASEHRENTIRLNALLAHSATIIASIDRDGIFTFVAGDALAGLGYQPEMLVGKNALELFASLITVASGKSMSMGELFARVILGETMYVTTVVNGRALDVRYGPLRRGGRIDGVMAVVHDVTERHEVEVRARDAEEQLRMVVQNTPMLLLAFDTTGKITLADGYSLRAICSPADVVGRSVSQLYSIFGQAPVVTAADGAPQSRGSVVDSALAGRSTAGIVRYGERAFEYHTVPLRRDGELVGGICVGVDVTDRHRVEEALRAADESLHIFMEASPDAVGVLRGDRFVFANRALAQALGYEPAELVGRSALDLVVADERDEAERNITRMANREVLRDVDRRLRRKDGSVATLHYSGVNIVFDGGPALVLIGSDVTEQRVMQRKLMLADRMASMGTMAAGVAHEINNPLAYVMANLSFVAETLAEAGSPAPFLRPQLLEALTDAREGAERVRQIVRDLKLFSRGDEQPRAAVDVNAVLESAINMAYNEIRHRARLVKDLAVVPPVYGSDSRLCQVFVNLLINAAQAIPDGAAAVHRIRVNTDVDSVGRIRVRISDTGAGIEPAQLGRIFDPFFTTKPVGVGTGLGLSISHQIVTELGGEMTVESEPGRGTTFTVLLPPAVQEAAAVVAPPAPSAPRKRARVLVIDDEPSVLTALRRTLGAQHDVTTIARAADALTLVRAGNVFDAVLCDVMMPDMNGCQLYREMSSLRPELCRRFAFLSGGVFANQAEGELAGLGAPLFEKPFDAAALRAFVARVGDEELSTS
ncbi:MAG: sensor histidine kinase/response regulator [Myxococcales bacterium]|nr:sensor histidine kinase/response regulator [Myxococcales bacterium]